MAVDDEERLRLLGNIVAALRSADDYLLSEELATMGRLVLTRLMFGEDIEKVLADIAANPRNTRGACQILAALFGYSCTSIGRIVRVRRENGKPRG